MNKCHPVLFKQKTNTLHTSQSSEKEVAFAFTFYGTRTFVDNRGWQGSGSEGMSIFIT